jgi:hypothetical protein
MLHHAGGPSRAALRLLVLHDDAEREFDYTAGAEQSLERAESEGWTVVSIKDDWSSVFADPANQADADTDPVAGDAPAVTRSAR